MSAIPVCISFVHVGLAARVLTPSGLTPGLVTDDVCAWRSRPAAARPAGCMWLWRLR